jgi:hypothetical protein
MVQSVGSRRVGHPRFVVWRRSGVETALAEANSFLCGCQPFCNIPRGFFGGLPGGVTAVAAVNHLNGSERGLTQPNLVSTLEQSPARGDTAAIQ